jgi:hypothetical protein
VAGVHRPEPQPEVVWWIQNHSEPLSGVVVLSGKETHPHREMTAARAGIQTLGAMFPVLCLCAVSCSSGSSAAPNDFPDGVFVSPDPVLPRLSTCSSCSSPP